jgi:hypothetical protein
VRRYNLRMHAARSGEREIIFPHDPTRGPVTAVRNVLLQTSLDELKAKGHYDRYVQLIAPEMLEQIQTFLAPGWVPIEIAHAHYAACERLGLTSEQTDRSVRTSARDCNRRSSSPTPSVREIQTSISGSSCPHSIACGGASIKAAACK